MAEPKRKILVIDDEATVHTLLRGILEREGFQIVSALDAVQGTMMIRQVKPDVIILDFMMPGGGGGSVFQRIRQSTQTMHYPILVFSSREKEEVIKSIALGPDTAFLAKPSGPAEIVAAVKALIPQQPAA